MKDKNGEEEAAFAKKDRRSFSVNLSVGEEEVEGW